MKNASEEIMVLKVYDFNVRCVKFKMASNSCYDYACYAEVPNSRCLSDEYLDAEIVSFRDEDEIGISTGMYSYMSAWAPDKELAKALDLMQVSLGKCMAVLKQD